MAIPDWSNWSVADFGAAYASGRTDPESVLSALFESIDSDTRGINAFCHLDRQGAASQAAASAARWRAGKPLGAFDGVPVSIKDLMNVAGWPTWRGSRVFEGDPPAVQDALVAARLREAGAVLFGKTTSTEFGWTIASINPHDGVTRNPVDTRRSAGGSSSGAAAQVAAGWGPLAIGSDAGGSVRIPASYCGVVGFKPTFAAIPTGTQSAFTEVAHLGPITRTAADCAAAMQLISFSHPRDPNSLFMRDDQPVSGPLRIGWTTGLGAPMQMQPAIATAFAALVERLKDEGHDIRPVAPMGLDCAQANWTLWAARIHESFASWPPEQRDKLSDALRHVHAEGASQSVADIARATAQLRGLTAQLWDLFSTLDILLTPATPTTAPLLDEAALTGVVSPDPEHGYNWFAGSGFSYPFNLTQQPALSLPLGRDAEGLPFGLQVVGRKYADASVLKIGLDLERLLG